MFIHRLGKFFRFVVEVNTISTSIDIPHKQCRLREKFHQVRQRSRDSIEFKYRDKIVIIYVKLPPF